MDQLMKKMILQLILGKLSLRTLSDLRRWVRTTLTQTMRDSILTRPRLSCLKPTELKRLVTT